MKLFSLSKVQKFANLIHLILTIFRRLHDEFLPL